jgi:hypothetical protein
LCDSCHYDLANFLRREPAILVERKGDVFRHRHAVEQRRTLKQETDATAQGRDLFIVELINSVAIEHDMAAGGIQETNNVL